MRDFFTLEKTCRELERRFGLKIDLGPSDRQENELSPKARDMEAHSWQESFERHVKGMKPELMDDLGRAADWASLHKSMAERGLKISKRGAGLVIADAEGKQAIKASSLDREWSAKSLAGRFGSFQPPRVDREAAQAHSSYQRRPLTSHANTARLWRRYLVAKRAPNRVKTGFSTWKQFLLLQVMLNDPLAAAVIVYRNKMMEALSPAKISTPPPPQRKLGADQLADSERSASQEWRKADWADARTAPQLAANGVRAFMIKAKADGAILVPARLDPGGRIFDLFMIDQSGQGKFMSGDMVKPGLHHLIDPEKRSVAPDTPLIIVQDYVTAAGLHQAVRMPVAVAFTADNLAAVAKLARAANADRRIIIIADAENALAAAEAARQARALVASAPEGNFVETAKAKGATAVRRILAETLGDEAFILWDKAAWSKIKGVKSAADGGLLIPGRDIDGNLVAIYCAADSGQPPNLAIGPSDRRDLVHIHDPDKMLATGKAVKIALANSLAEAGELHAKLGIPVMIPLAANGRPAVIERINRRWPKVAILDHGRESGRERGM